MKKKHKLKTELRLRAYTIVTNAVSYAIEAGIRRARKHTEQPQDSHIAECVEIAVIGALCDVIDFGDP